MSDQEGMSGALRSSSLRRGYLLLLCLLAVSFMLFQIALLRELRFQLTTLFTLTPFLFSSVILWIALGSLCAHRVKSHVREVLRRLVLVLPLLIIPLFAASIGISHYLITDGDVGDNARFQAAGAISLEAQDAYFHSTIVAFIAVAVLGYGPVFFLQGLIFSLYFREGRSEGILSEVYGADLLASGLGAILGGVLNFFLTPVQMVLVGTILFLIPVWISIRLLELRAWTAGLVTAAALALVLGGELLTGFLSGAENPRWLYITKHTIWSRYRRIDAREAGRFVQIFTDGMIFQGYDKVDNDHLKDPRSVPVRLIKDSQPPASRVLIIGAGSGADVRILRHMIGDRLRIVAVELDAGFVKTAQCFPWLWDTYKTAEVIVQEGRFYLENAREDFDAVIFAYIDPQSTVGSIGIPDANFLYTDAGIRAAYQRVRDGGYLFINRVYLEHEQESFVRRMCATLESAGIPREQVALYRGTGSFPNGYFGQVNSLHVLIRKGGTPAQLTDGRIRIPWAEGGRPTTDLFPFSLGTGIWFDTLLSYVRRNTLPAAIGVAVLIVLSALLGTSLSRSTFFTLGFGSFLLESLVLFNSFLLFGDPNWGAALAIGVFLIWNGVGSFLSSRFESRGWLKIAVPAVVLFYALSAPVLNAWTISAGVSVRTVVFAAHLALPGIAAGMMFPIALRKFREESVPWMFFMDVVGCALAPPVFWIAVSLIGIWLVMAGATLSYALVSLVLAMRR